MIKSPLNCPSDFRTVAATKDELIFQLSSVRSFTINENTRAIYITHKYYEQAEFVLYRINIWNPSTPPIFIINCADLSRTLLCELAQLKKTDPPIFDRIVTAIQSLMEGINERYYHVSGIAYKTAWRFDP